MSAKCQKRTSPRSFDHHRWQRKTVVGPENVPVAGSNLCPEPDLRPFRFSTMITLMQTPGMGGGPERKYERVSAEEADCLRTLLRQPPLPFYGEVDDPPELAKRGLRRAKT